MKRAGAGARIAVAVCLAVLTPARAQEPAVAPTFVDPHRHLDKPDLKPGRIIRFLTSDDAPPFGFPGPEGLPAGYNVELARLICEVLEVTCSVQARSFEALLPALQAGGGDAVIASLSITAKARASFGFSLPTLRMAARFAARSGAAPASVLPETVERLVIGVQAGTAHEAYLRQMFPRAIVKPFTDPDSLRTALREGAVDLLFADGLATALWLGGSASFGCCRFAGGPFTEPRFFGEGAGIATRKDDEALRQGLDYALQRLAQEGRMADLYLKYFPLGFF